MPDTFPSNTTLTIQRRHGNANGVDDGILLDSFVLGQSAVANGANYYLPEESLSKLTGARSKGNWVLEVLDNRAGATNPPPTMLVSWQLSLVLADTVPLATPLGNGVAQTNTVQPGSVNRSIFCSECPAVGIVRDQLAYKFPAPVAR